MLNRSRRPAQRWWLREKGLANGEIESADRKRAVQDQHRRAAFEYLTLMSWKGSTRGWTCPVSRRLTPLLPNHPAWLSRSVTEERQCDSEPNDPSTDHVTLVQNERGRVV